MRFFRDLLIAGATAFLVALALEGVLRATQAHFEASLYQPEDERGYSLRPNSEGWSTEETDVYIRINSDGLRDQERPIVRPPNTLRVAVIGSSEADARQVPLEKTFESVMKRDLSRALEPRGWHVDVLNFGVPGYTFSQEFLTLRNHVWKYQPQVVVLLFSAFPVLKNTREFYPGELKGAPVFNLHGDGELVPDEITRNTPPLNSGRVLWKNRISDWMNRSELLCLLNMVRVKAPLIIQGLRLRPRNFSNGVSESWSYNPDQPEIRESWAIAEAFLRDMKTDCERHGAEFWIVASDLGMQVHPDLAARAAFQRRFHLASLDLVDRRVASFGAAHEIPVLALSRPLGEYAASHNVFLQGPLGSRNNEGHWNEIAHQIVGDSIAQALIVRSLAVLALESEPDR